MFGEGQQLFLLLCFSIICIVISVMTFKNTDLIVLLPIGYEFPIYRKFLIDNHHHFGKIICVLTGNCSHYTEENYSYIDFLKSTMPFAHFVESCHEPNISIQSQGLIVGAKEVRKEADGVLVMEPDVIIENLDAFLNLPDIYDIVTLLFSNKFSPSFLWVKKSVLDKVSQPFVDGIFDNIYYMNDVNNKTTNDSPLKDRLAKYDQYHCDVGLKITSDLVQVADSLFCFDDDTMGFYHQTEVIRMNDLYRRGKDTHAKGGMFYGLLACPHKKWKRYIDKSLQTNIPTFGPYMDAYTGMKQLMIDWNI